MIAGFTTERIGADGADINVALGGTGSPVLLLHGYPQTHAMWHRVAPLLAERFRVVAADLRGYGDSAKPPGDARHETYSKRAMAGDMVAVMDALGFDRFAVVGHDRGARVAHRMAMDHPGRVERLAVLDIVPTHHLFATADRAFADAYWHWFFLSQRPPLPEALIGGAPRAFLHALLERWAAAPGALAPEAVAEYERCWDAATIHASCEDYRAAASIDLEHDDADLGTRVACPTLVVWGELGRMGRLYDVMATWRARAADVRGVSLPCGHFVAEEEPAACARELLAFLTSG
ncbi:MAG: alpha/beta hydrolase [Actinomycetota bacterium]